MNDEAALPSRPDADHFAPRDYRLAPALVIELRLEDPGRVQIRAGSYEDELRLRLWLRHASRLPTLAAAIERHLLDEREAA